MSATLTAVSSLAANAWLDFIIGASVVIIAVVLIGEWWRAADRRLQDEIDTVLGPRRCGVSYGSLRCDRAAGHDLPHADSTSGRERPVQWVSAEERGGVL